MADIHAPPFSFTRLRSARMENDLRLRDIAEETGLSVGYLNRIERGFVQDIKRKKEERKLLIACILRLERDIRRKERRQKKR